MHNRSVESFFFLTPLFHFEGLNFLKNAHKVKTDVVVFEGCG